jgi:dipeptidyl aminopeptidase/acylaminoacyl peptidase
MTRRLLLGAGLLVAAALPSVHLTSAQDADVRTRYDRADSFGERTQNRVVNQTDAPQWIEGTSKFWYRKSVTGGNEFVLVDAAAAHKSPAFDHARLAASLSTAAAGKYTAVTLPFATFTYSPAMDAIEFTIGGGGGGRAGGGGGRAGGGPGAGGPRWRCTLTDYSCARVAAPGGAGAGGPGRQGRGAPAAGGTAAEPAPRVSPDGKLEALIQNYNVFVRAVGQTRDGTMLSFDGSEGTPYRLQTVVWSPDSKKLAAYKVKPGYDRLVHYVESSPTDQVQPKYTTRVYRKPGDPVDISLPSVFDIDAKKQLTPDAALFSNPYAMSPLVWRDDSRAVTFEYNQRGHQVFRVIEIDAATGAARAVVDEVAEKTFFCYYDKKFRHDVADGREVIWMSERDGWNHLYLYDGGTGRVKNQITTGEWVVRDVDHVDEKARQIYFRASGMYPGKDPYLLHAYRINFDGTGLVALTEADAQHTVTYSPDRAYYVDSYSRVDLPQVTELRRTSERSVVMALEKADASALLGTGWKLPEVFSAKGRDGTTDIWGVIIRPTNFDPSRKYPVIENIYAGPHSAFVPKTFSPQAGMNALAELGFIVVQIDGMGTSNRSKAFHDVAWKNIRDAGFPDRIKWHQAVAAKYPWYDITRVGIYGTSAGGQNSTGALLFHSDFYDVAVSAVGCHDNRMDKISWNEQWMGWPIGPEYAESSNVVSAHQLKGRLLLVVGELDTNVDPSSTLQVANALIRANKDFDFLYLPGQGHGPGGAYGTRKRNDYFVKHLLGLEPPAWNAIDPPATRTNGDPPPDEEAWLYEELPAPRRLDPYWDGY